MPSPLGHALGGVLAGGAVAGRAASSPTAWRRDAALFALIGMAPDLDFLVGQHSQHTHSIGAALIVGGLALAAARRWPGIAPAAPRGRLRWALAAAAAYGSHILLDALGHDTTPPLGVMAFWPCSGDFYQSPFPVFMAISRRYWLPGFLIHNLTAVAWELALLGPLVMLVWWRRVRCRSSSNPREATS